jgi:hypothetical protein
MVNKSLISEYNRLSVTVASGCVMEIDIGPIAYLALGATMLGAGTLIVGMIWQLVDLVRHG